MRRDTWTLKLEKELNASKKAMNNMVTAVGEGEISGEALDAGMEWLKAMSAFFDKMEKRYGDKR